MIFDKNLAVIHGYLCGDGYVIKNPETQKHKYYYIGFRNTNTVLLKDFQKRFSIYFGITPIITKDGRCKIQNKKIFYLLTKNFSYYSNEWKIPNMTKNLLKHWLRAYFDCDAWVALQKAKSRAVMIESVNEKGLNQIKNILKDVFKITASELRKRSNRNIWYTYICGKKNIEKFKDEIGFLHPFKKCRLIEAIKSYETYKWNIPNANNDLLEFIKTRGKTNKKRGEIRFNSILKDNLLKLKCLIYSYGINSKIYGPWTSGSGSEYYYLLFKENDINKIGNANVPKTKTG